MDGEMHDSEIEVLGEIVRNPEIRLMFEQAERIRRQMADDMISVAGHKRRAHAARMLYPDD